MALMVTRDVRTKSLAITHLPKDQIFGVNTTERPVLALSLIMFFKSSTIIVDSTERRKRVLSFSI